MSMYKKGSTNDMGSKVATPLEHLDSTLSSLQTVWDGMPIQRRKKSYKAVQKVLLSYTIRMLALTLADTSPASRQSALKLLIYQIAEQLSPEPSFRLDLKQMNPCKNSITSTPSN